ncbi:2-dehydro-3-deoxygalactonokinase [Marinomonas flavescens]|uniref:2-dehydro-3-deoxygalactonokinase n=1 Tax=Marinomonas flavescens TaxID=2529379 RepID=UPI0010558B26|nr:2-dehydro-3-deoxygalactonokinase [Marinomonas flavescens]
MKNIDWLIIDWGTTNFRAFAMNKNGTLVKKTERRLGLLQIDNNEFALALQTVLDDWLGEYKSLPIYMAGMVGSAQGWVNAPYAEAPVSISHLAQKSVQFTLPWGAQATIVPGVSYESTPKHYDVMRGEEVQLFGLQSLENKESFVAVFPGTHSKHMYINESALSSFTTFMTGEMFSILSKHSILGMGLPDQHASITAFEKGINESGQKPLTSQLFATRTHRLFGNLKECDVLDYLSGLLIGEELKALTSNRVYLVGGEALCCRYKTACELLGIEATIANGDDAFLNGMLQIKKALNDDK